MAVTIPKEPTAIQNIDAINMIARIRVLLQEIIACPSSSTNSTHPEDLKIWGNLWADWKKYFNLATKPDRLMSVYTPNWHPEPSPMPEPPDLLDLQNNNCNLLTSVLAVLWVERASGGSAEHAFGFEPEEAGNLGKLVTRIDDILVQIGEAPSVYSPNSQNKLPGAPYPVIPTS